MIPVCRDCWYTSKRFAATRYSDQYRSSSDETSFLSYAHEIPMTSHWVFVVSNTARAARFPTQTHKQSIDYVHLCASSAFACVFSTSTILSHNVRSAHWLRCDCTRCLTHFSGRRQYNNRNVVCCLQWAAVWSFFERSIHRSVAFLFCGLDSMPLPPSLLLAAYCSSFF